MDLLSYVGQLSRRKDKLIARARDLYHGHKSIESMEREMAERNAALVARLREDRIRMSEFQRIAADETITALAAAYMLGVKKDQLSFTQYSQATKTLPYLWKFFASIEKAIKEERLTTSPEYAEIVDIEDLIDMYSGDFTDEELQEWLEQFPDRDLSGDAGKSIPATWGGVETRLSQYLVAPIYGYVSAGEMDLMRATGAREMRRVSKGDKKRCEDCAMYDAQGWVPIGLLPPPGERCRCHYNCRCQVIYR